MSLFTRYEVRFLTELLTNPYSSSNSVDINTNRLNHLIREERPSSDFVEVFHSAVFGPVYCCLMRVVEKIGHRIGRKEQIDNVSYVCCTVS